MADFVFTRLFVTGEPKDIAQFRAQAAATDEAGCPTALSFERFIPMPAALKVELDGKEAEIFNLLEEIRSGQKCALNSVFAQAHGIKDLHVLESELRRAEPLAFAVATHLQLQLDALEHRSWRNWREAHWGTKWDAGNVQLVKEAPHFLLYRYETPWFPADPITKEMSRQHPSLKFQVRVEFEAGDPTYTEEWVGGTRVGLNCW